MSTARNREADYRGAAPVMLARAAPRRKLPRIVHWHPRRIRAVLPSRVLDQDHRRDRPAWRRVAKHRRKQCHA